MIAMPATMGACTKLQSLNFANNSMADIVESIMGLSLLEELDMTNNGASSPRLKL